MIAAPSQEVRELRARGGRHQDAAPAREHAAELRRKDKIGRIGRLRQDMQVGEP